MKIAYSIYGLKTPQFIFLSVHAKCAANVGWVTTQQTRKAV